MQKAASDDKTKALYVKKQEMNQMANARLREYSQQIMWMQSLICKEYMKSIGNSH